MGFPSPSHRPKGTCWYLCPCSGADLSLCSQQWDVKGLLNIQEHPITLLPGSVAVLPLVTPQPWLPSVWDWDGHWDRHWVPVGWLNKAMPPSAGRASPGWLLPPCTPKPCTLWGFRDAPRVQPATKQQWSQLENAPWPLQLGRAGAHWGVKEEIGGFLLLPAWKKNNNKCMFPESMAGSLSELLC